MKNDGFALGDTQTLWVHGVLWSPPMGKFPQTLRQVVGQCQEVLSTALGTGPLAWPAPSALSTLTSLGSHPWNSLWMFLLREWDAVSYPGQDRLGCAAETARPKIPVAQNQSFPSYS